MRGGGRGGGGGLGLSLQCFWQTAPPILVERERSGYISSHHEMKCLSLKQSEENLESDPHRLAGVFFLLLIRPGADSCHVCELALMLHSGELVALK